MTKPKSALNPEKSRDILSAAQSLFAEYGYKKVTIDDISAKLGITRTALYYYYRDKEAIFVAVLEHEIEEYGIELQAESLQGKTTDDQIDKFCRQYFLLRKKFVNLYKLSIAEYSHPLNLKEMLRRKIFVANCTAIESILSQNTAASKKSDCAYAAAILAHSIRGISTTPDLASFDAAEVDCIYLFKTFVAGLVSRKQ